MPELADLIGPAAALVLALGILYLFYTGRILPRNTVPREAFDAQVVIVASYAAHLKDLTEAVKVLTATVDRVVPPNGGK